MKNVYQRGTPVLIPWHSGTGAKAQFVGKKGRVAVCAGDAASPYRHVWVVLDEGKHLVHFFAHQLDPTHLHSSGAAAREVEAVGQMAG